MWLANQTINCIIVSPLTANSVGKLVNGIADNYILNIISSGKKADQAIGIFPTDRKKNVQTSVLPVRLIKPLPKTKFDPNICEYNALTNDQSFHTQFNPEYCVGCRSCVKNYPAYFSVDEKINIKIRPIDYMNSRKLANEFQILRSPVEISNFVYSGIK